MSFDIQNNSPYSYWTIDVQVKIYNGGVPAGINHILVNQLKSGETRSMNLLWNNSLPTGASYEILPVVNFLDNQNIMPVGQ